MKTNKIKETDIEYLEKEFPKGETKFRGQAMVLLALAREQSKKQATADFINEEIKRLKRLRNVRHYWLAYVSEDIEKEIKRLSNLKQMLVEK
jgi:flagellar motor switch protein FliG